MSCSQKKVIAHRRTRSPRHWEKISRISMSRGREDLRPTAVLENNSVDFDVYALTESDAMETASELCGWIRDLEGETVETTCYASEVTSLPYNNPDPRHPNLPRTTIKAQILVRNKEV